MIHPTAVIHKKAKIDKNVEIGPYCTIDGPVKISKGTKLISHVVVQGRTTIGEDCTISPFASLGGAPQDITYNGEDTQVIIVEVCENIPATPAEKTNVTFKVENYVDKNTTDFLKSYEELIKISRSPETEIIAKSVENEVSSVDPNCGCFTAEQANLIAQAQGIIKNAPIH